MSSRPCSPSSSASYYTGTFGVVHRSDADGRYLGVSSRGNFYMSWAPGQTFWQPHNRRRARPASLTRCGAEHPRRPFAELYADCSPNLPRFPSLARSSARRIQSMGYTPEGGLWLLTRGGSVYFSTGKKAR